MADRMEQLKKMLAAEPNDAFCAYGLALEHAKRGETTQALEWFDRTLAADPDYCYAYFHKAKAQQSVGDDLAAMQTLQAGLNRARSCRDLKAAGEIEAFLDELQE